MYRLYYSPGACSLAVHIALEESGLPYALELCSARNGGEGTGALGYLALNPKGRVPALAGVPGRAVVAKGHENLREHYAFIESVLADGRGWAVPGGYSVADAFLLVFWRWGGRVGFDMPGAFPAWTALARCLAARPAIRRALHREALDQEPAIAALLCP
ncbi:glutathione binding-like protein [Roseomonas sp. GC11]|uniref:glutathione S-transferase n=1 Tax=Roseomonas sp. GC11 TaxID=2950546 RepID=UPI00210ADAAF|nr:glutathione S-transferase [Roseomonas sp. GC11]MCQ4159411.1 glutathione binding-like protein [Roseomonas sp. GC11]